MGCDTVIFLPHKPSLMNVTHQDERGRKEERRREKSPWTTREEASLSLSLFFFLQGRQLGREEEGRVRKVDGSLVGAFCLPFFPLFFFFFFESFLPFYPATLATSPSSSSSPPRFPTLAAPLAPPPPPPPPRRSLPPLGGKSGGQVFLLVVFFFLLVFRTDELRVHYSWLKGTKFFRDHIWTGFSELELQRMGHHGRQGGFFHLPHILCFT